MKSLWLLAISLALLSACSVEGPAKINGGGTMPSAGGAQKAVATVNADTCGTTPKGRVTYADRSAVDFEKVGGVSLRADIVKAGVCAGPSLDPTDPLNVDAKECNCPMSPSVVATYTSTNPSAPGTGKLVACFLGVRDQTKEGSDKHVVSVQEIRLEGGPYDKYLNKGVLDGNVQIFTCKQ